MSMIRLPLVGLDYFSLMMAAEELVPCQRLMYGADQVVGAGFFENVAGSAALLCIRYVGVIIVHR